MELFISLGETGEISKDMPLCIFFSFSVLSFLFIIPNYFS